MSAVLTTKLVFGATGHIGSSVVRTLTGMGVRVRAASSRLAGVVQLKTQFPQCDCIMVDMLDSESLIRALDGVSAVFVVTPDFFGDRRGMELLIQAIQHLGGLTHIVRIQAEVPGMTIERLKGQLAGAIGRRGHLEARALVEASGLPATFLNSLAYYMDDFTIHFAPALKTTHRLLVPYDRPMCFIDPRELGEAAAYVMAVTAPVGTELMHLNNGEDGIYFSAVAAMISEVTGVPIKYESDPAVFLAEIGPMLIAMTGRADAADYLLADWQMERENAHIYKGNDSLERLIGRKPLSLRNWMIEHREVLVSS